jgi:hypothetical protein
MTHEKHQAELKATEAVYAALEPLDEGARRRVLNHIIDMLEIATEAQMTTTSEIEQSAATEVERPRAVTYKTFADLFDAAGPESNVDKALVAGYWIQVCERAENFDGLAANALLKNVNHRLPNITNAIAGLNAQRPALALQIAKSGNSKQARKTYKVTPAGMGRVQETINGRG